MVTVIDSEDKIKKLLPLLDEMVDEGMIAISEVEVIKYVHQDGLPLLTSASQALQAHRAFSGSAAACRRLLQGEACLAAPAFPADTPSPTLYPAHFHPARRYERVSAPSMLPQRSMAV